VRTRISIVVNASEINRRGIFLMISCRNGPIIVRSAIKSGVITGGAPGAGQNVATTSHVPTCCVLFRTSFAYAGRGGRSHSGQIVGRSHHDCAHQRMSACPYSKP
jgi:hypothetical protein